MSCFVPTSKDDCSTCEFASSEQACRTRFCTSTETNDECAARCSTDDDLQQCKDSIACKNAATVTDCEACSNTNGGNTDSCKLNLCQQATTDKECEAVCPTEGLVQECIDYLGLCEKAQTSEDCSACAPSLLDACYDRVAK